LVTDLTAASGASVTVGKGSAFPYVRSDNWNTIVYVGSDDHIHELASLGSGWGDADLSFFGGDTGVPSSDPVGVKRADGYNCVLFVGTDNQIHQLAFLPSNGFWWTSNVASDAKAGLFQRPSAYVTADGFDAIVYTRLSDDRIIELLLFSGAWHPQTLPTGCVRPIGQLFGHAPPSGLDSVLFQGKDSTGVKRYELSIPPGSGSWSLTSF
jgi:hypothetical protein